MLLTGTGAKNAIELAEELLAMVRSHRVLARDKPVQVTTSIGISMLGAANLSAEQLLMEADVAMYRIKRALREDMFAVYAHPSQVWGPWTRTATSSSSA